MLDSRIPGFASADRRSRWKIIVSALMLTVITAVVTSYFQFGFNLLTLRATAKAEDSVGDEIEAGKEPFVMAVTPSNDVASAFRDNTLGMQWIAFEDPLSLAEQEQVLARPIGNNFPVDEFLKMLEGFTNKPLLIYSAQNHMRKETHRLATPYKMTLQSDRTKAVSIRAMDAVELQCSESRISTVIYLHPEGNEVVDNVAVDLVGDTLIHPLLRQEPEAYPNPPKTYPYFSRSYIELGNGQTSWANNLDVLTGKDQCSWSFKVSYVSKGTQHTTTLRDSRFRTPGLPDMPRQLLEFRPDGKGWKCWGDQIATEASCSIRASVSDPGLSAPTMIYWGSLPSQP
ncbi:hypothetical protein OG381_00405 [Streptomyces sp. NBC_00490]|uniref:hypothetical protein n=1 Tax=Streptomyces sp. NBC_00490 TaxID=2903657 RepID=UPI002E178CB5